MDAVRGAAARGRGIRGEGAAALPVGTIPQRAVDDAAWYPLYATCIDLGIPFVPCMGIPGPACRSRRST